MLPASSAPPLCEMCLTRRITVHVYLISSCFAPTVFRFSPHRNYSGRGGHQAKKARREVRTARWQPPPTDDACLRQQQQQQRYPGSLAAPSDTRCWPGWRGVAHLSLGPPDAHLVAECPVRHLPARATLTACTSAAPAHTAHRCQQHCPGNMSRVEAAAATRDYALKPRLEYRTVAGVNGPLVILEVRRCPCAQYFLAPVQKSGLRLGMLVVRAFAAADLLTAVPVAYRMCAGRDSPRS